MAVKDIKMAALSSPSSLISMWLFLLQTVVFGKRIGCAELSDNIAAA
jgi:hypothetical protein